MVQLYRIRYTYIGTDSLPGLFKVISLGNRLLGKMEYESILTILPNKIDYVTGLLHS